MNRRGFTLIELALVLAVASILLAFALPSFLGSLEASRSQDARGSLLASVVSAVNQATLTGRRTVLCPGTEGLGCADTADWSGGWMVFIDTDADGQYDAGERIVTRRGTLSGKVRLRTTEGRKRLTFQPSGSNAGSNATFTLCDGRGPAFAQTLVLNNAGQMRYGTPTAEAASLACPD